MRRHPQSLKTLREIALAHSLDRQPDLALLARELGGIIHRDADALGKGLAGLRRRNRGFERWLLARRSRPAVSVLVMAWPPGYATPAHDHAGLWGLELSLYGALEVESWTRPQDAIAWQRHGRDWLGPGDATWFDADVVHMHRCRNLSRHESALSLHVYGGDLSEYFSYEQAAVDQPWQTQPQRAAIAGHLRI